jgi:hypothetical protein
MKYIASGRAVFTNMLQTPRAASSTKQNSLTTAAECLPVWLPIMKSILSAVPAPKENPQRGKAQGRALPIEFVELSRTESYGY